MHAADLADLADSLAWHGSRISGELSAQDVSNSPMGPGPLQLAACRHEKLRWARLQRTGCCTANGKEWLA